MKKLLVSFIDLVFIIVFNIVFFSIGSVNHILATWIAYSFIHISYIILLLTSLIIKDKENAVIFNIPIISVTSIYFVTQLIVNVLFIVFVLSSTIIVLIINIIILAIYLVLIFSIIISNIDTKKQQEKQKQELKYINECSSNLQVILSKVTDAELQYKIEQAYDIIRTSQVESNNLVYDIEIRIDNQIRQLRYELAKEQIDNAINIANEIIDLANERNIKLKILN